MRNKCSKFVVDTGEDESDLARFNWIDMHTKSTKVSITIALKAYKTLSVAEYSIQVIYKVLWEN